MRFCLLVGCSLLGTLLLSSSVYSDSPAVEAESTEIAEPFAKLQAMGLPFSFSMQGNSRLHSYPSKHSKLDFSKFDPSEVERIQIKKPKDHRLDLANLPEGAFDTLLLFPELSIVEFESCYVAPNRLQRLKEIFNLTTLVINRSCGKDRQVFQKVEDFDFLAELPRLESLKLTFCGLTNASIEKLEGYPLESLQELWLDGNEKLTHAIVPQILKKMPLLTSFGMKWTKYNAGKMETRRLASKLKYFSYYYSPAERRESHEKYNFKELQEILTMPRRIWSHRHRTDVPLSKIFAILPEVITRIEYKSGELELNGVDSNKQRFTFNILMTRELSAEDFDAIGQLAELRSLSLKIDKQHPPKGFRLQFTDEKLGRLTGLPKLEHLEINQEKWGYSYRKQPHYLTTRSLSMLSKMPSLAHVTLSPVNFGGDALKWVRNTRKLHSLTLPMGIVAGDALEVFVDPSLSVFLKCGKVKSYNRHNNHELSFTKPSRPFTINGIRRLELHSQYLSEDEYEIIGRMRALTSLHINGPIADVHLQELSSLKQLSNLDIQSNHAKDGKLTARGHLVLSCNRSYLSLNSRAFDSPLGGPERQAMADQFNWFLDIGCGCCGDEPMRGIDWWPEDIISGRLQKKEVKKPEFSRSLRIRGPVKSDRLTIDIADIPSLSDTVCLTDCQIKTLEFKGWVPKSLRIWKNSSIEKILFTETPTDQQNAELEIGYYFLEDQKGLTIPASKHLTKVIVAQCDQLELVILKGNYPNLTTVELRELDKLSNFRAAQISYYTNAPQHASPYIRPNISALKLKYPTGLRFGDNLPLLHILNLSGITISTAAEREANKQVKVFPKPKQPSPWFPKTVTSVDLRNTDITDEWLEQLATLPSLRILYIKGCTKLTAPALNTFRTKYQGILRE